MGSGRRGTVLVFLSLLAMAVIHPARAATTLTKATTSRATRDEAMRAIPYDKLTPEASARISSVVDKPSMYRRMPVNVVECEASLYRFLVRHPEVVVNIWQLMGITQVDAKRIGPYTIDATDGVGTVTKVELIYGSNDTHLIFCEGRYDGPLFRQPLTGRCVLLLRSGYQESDTSATTVTNQLDVFLQVDNIAVDVFTRTLHPLLGKSADINFVESTGFLERVSRTSAENGPGMRRLASRLDKVDPDIRDQFATLTDAVHEAALERIATAHRATDSR